MKNFYFYKMDLSSNKPNVMVCFYAGGDFNFEAFCDEVVTQFKSSIFKKDNSETLSPVEKSSSKIALSRKAIIS